MNGAPQPDTPVDGDPTPAVAPPRIDACVRATYADDMADPDFDAFALVPKGHAFEDFDDGQLFEHHWGRTLNEGDNSLFATLALRFRGEARDRTFAE